MTDADKSDEIMLEDIAFAPITQLHGWIANQAISSRRLTEIYLERIARIGPKLECFATVTGDLALVASRCHVPCAMCHVPCAMCHVPCAMCQRSRPGVSRTARDFTVGATV